MNEKTVAKLDSPELWREFALISDIPRGSRNEAAIIAHISRLAAELHLENRLDSTGNLLVRLPASSGKETCPGLILQGHVDMVCEKDSGTVHDFLVDPIRLVVDGEWLRADRTTLGADNGIAVAMMIALLRGQYRHGPIDLLFTIDEESGLTGAMNLDPSMLNYRSLINIDGEEEGIFYIGCAGGKETLGSLALELTPPRVGDIQIGLGVIGLGGGHSGADIHLQPGNALKLLARFLWNEYANLDFTLSDFYGGDKHNAICREAFCTLWIAKEKIPLLHQAIVSWQGIYRKDFQPDEPEIEMRFFSEARPETPIKPTTTVLSQASQKSLLGLLYTLPHGVLSMSRTMPGLVSTSTNLAAVKIVGSRAEFVTSQRSDIPSTMDDAGRLVAAHFESWGAGWNFTREYPSWTPKPKSRLLENLLQCYGKLYEKKTAKVASIHAGLECGVIGSRQTGMDMVSLGPDIRGAHTPQERVNIASTGRMWRFLLAFLGEYPCV